MPAKKTLKNLTDYSKRGYVSEKKLLEPVYELFSRLEKITEEDQSYLVEQLRTTTMAEVSFHKTQVSRIRAEHDRIKQRDDGLLEALLDKSITKEIYDKKHQEHHDKIQMLGIELEQHSQGDHDYQNTVAVVFSLARRAREIFDSSEPNQKRAFLNYLLQNPTVQGKNLEFSIRSPFDLVMDYASSPNRGAVVEDVRTVFMRRNDATIYIPSFSSLIS